MDHENLESIYQAAVAAYAKGDLRTCENLLHDLLSLAHTARSAVDARWKALAFEALARLQLDSGNKERAWELLHAGAEVSLDPDNADIRGRILYQVAIHLGELPMLRNRANGFLEEAVELLGKYPEYGYLLETADRSHLDQPADWLSHRRLLEEELRAMRKELYNRSGKLLSLRAFGRRRHAAEQLREQIRHKQLSLAALLLEHGTDTEAESALRALLRHCTHYAEQGLVGDFFFTAHNVMHVQDRPHITIPDELDQLADQAQVLAMRSPSKANLAYAQYIRAVALRNRGSTHAAQPHALSSVRLMETSITSQSSTVMRAQNSVELHDMRALALDVSLAIQDFDTMAELIESARLSAPAAPVTEDEGDQYPDLLKATRAALGQLTHVSAGEGSMTMALASESVSSDDVVSLDDLIQALGGNRCWYWGEWSHLGKIYWSVRSPEGVWTSGRTMINERLRRALEDVQRDYEDYFAGGSTNPAWLSYETELELATEVGHGVIPQHLATALLIGEQEIPLAVSGRILPSLPLPLLVIPGTRDTRLVEKATIRWQPPATLAAGLASRCQPAHPLHFAIACVDPTGNLKHASKFPVKAASVLTHSTNVKKRLGARAATRSNFLDAVASLTDSTSSIMMYSGHVEQLAMRHDNRTALALEDAFLTAAEISEALGPRSMAGTVVFSACDSSGVGGVSSGEWLGLAASMLELGVSQFVGTAWPVPDREFLSEFETQLVLNLLQIGDAARALRQTQLSALKAWRRSELESFNDLTTAFPLDWAGFQVAGRST